ncbi:glycerol uptake protein, putative [Leishmania panamensis]|uniref:Glycerol uptake protein, putative n=2 Tax=Leishmania panamensis TaxID=5679 RepID=A0A088RNN4_LEIPA
MRLPQPRDAAALLPPPPSSTLTTSRGCRLHLLSPTTELDIGAAEYSTIYSRLCSIEYLLPAATCLLLILYGFAILASFCNKNFSSYKLNVTEAMPLLGRMGSKGYDNTMDDQWTGFSTNYNTLVCVALILGGFSAFYRKLLFRQTASSSYPSSGAAVSPLLLVNDELSAALGSRVRAQTSPVVCGKPHPRCRALRPLSVAPRGCTAFLQGAWILPAFYTITGFIFVAAVHGPHFFLPLLLIIANYVIFSRLQRLCPYWLFMATMWATHVAGLYIIEIANGFEGTYWLQYFFTTSADEALNLLGYEQKPLWDTNMRWAISFRMSTLRLISFNYDLWEATHAAARARERATAKHDATCIECAQLREQNAALAAALPAEASRCYKYRTEYPRDPADYNFVNYAAYTLFPPLYLGGPMSSFNAFVSYMRVPSTSMPLRKMVTYAFAIFRIYATTVLLLHFVHVPALARHSYLITEMSLPEQAHFVFLTLAYLWLKFNFIWKSSRLFAMLSGIEVPEDMRRCFANTLTVRDFWRDWHASFNLWVVRYMYIPMGGSSRVALSVLPIFLFIALWHDPVLHLVKWALCIAVMFMAEVAVSGCFGWTVAAFRREMAAVALTGAVNDATLERESPITDPVRRRLLARLARLCARRLSPRVQSFLYRQLRVAAGMSSVFGLIVANSVGFSMQNGLTDSNGGAKPAHADADFLIAKALMRVTPTFTLGVVAFMYSVSSLAVIDREMTRQQTLSLKRLYCLK